MEQTKKSLAEQRNKLCVDMEMGLKTVSKIKDQLPSLTTSTNEVAQELKKSKKEWSD
ncbi:hypothetical protein SLEP1_g24730 [Rubroshorea leprosula]|uniref:Uncharacterized protein n=1 Tax=Rubroshorea leprosula TaxID=152421 RepID=A0AAV5JLV9_9ROSI|nr:hypothetical protein SLEP1_g24730 [Rubroshorea leprosula]